MILKKLFASRPKACPACEVRGLEAWLERSGHVYGCAACGRIYTPSGLRAYRRKAKEVNNRPAFASARQDQITADGSDPSQRRESALCRG